MSFSKGILNHENIKMGLGNLKIFSKSTLQGEIIVKE
jgi:hypothetical protein